MSSSVRPLPGSPDMLTRFFPPITATRNIDTSDTNHFQTIVGILFFSLLYWGLTRLSLDNFMMVTGVATLWPAIGLGFAMLFLWGHRFWPAIFLAEMEFFVFDAITLGKCSTALGNTLVLLLSVYLVQRFTDKAHLLGRIKYVLIFLLAGVVLASTLSAMIGISRIYIENSTAYDNWLNIAWAWWLSDVVGMLIVAPTIISWYSYRFRGWYHPRRLEKLSLYLLAFAAAWLVFCLPLSKEMQAYPLTFTMMPFILWSAFRFGQRETMFIMILLSVVAVWGTVTGTGPFVHMSAIYQSLLLLQTFIVVLGLTALLLTAAITERIELDKSMARFVPREFLGFLDKDTMLDVKLGDKSEQHMTILFSDIRHFTTLSEKMTPSQNFDFINNYMGRMEPVVSANRGFIDKYIGDSIMALFPQHADDAVRAAIGMLTALNTYNADPNRPGYAPLRIGIGIHTGKVMLGTVGGQDRMDGTVISDAVNVAARVEELTKAYDLQLLITDETYRELDNVMQHHIRVVDRVTVRGKSEPITIFEIFDADPADVRRLKSQTRSDFEMGFIHYNEGRRPEAREFFEKVLAENPGDKLAQVYLQRTMG